jgi:hypothetical protein
MNAVANVLEAQLSVVDWFKRIEPRAVLSSSRALVMLGSSKTLAAKTYASIADMNYRSERVGQLVDKNV